MVVAGDHANNDMADPDDPESWYSMFQASGKFADVACQIEGLGRIEAVQALYVAHTKAAMDEKGLKAEIAAPTAAAPLADGVYTVTFKTDHSMFKTNEMYKDRFVLTVRNGQMSIHIVMASKNILNLYQGLKEDAQKEGAAILQPTIEKVDYQDGTEPEEVYAYDVPVPVIGEEFDLALIGKAGKWYDHKVIVTDPVPQA